VRHTVSRGEVVVDDTGAVTGIRGTTQDVTAQVESAVELAGAREALSLRTFERDQEQRVKEALQQVVLPAGLPALPRVSIAASYQSADVPADVGGDWYDAFEVSADELVVAVGDVSGHDLASAAAMGQLRNSLRGYAMEGHRPAAVLTRLNQLMMAFSPDLLASAIYGHLDTRTALFTWACAGHPPPIVVSPLGCRLLQPPAGVLLGAATAPHFATAHMTLGGQQILLLYTDGLVERRGAGLTEGIERLLRVAAEAPVEDVDAFCSEVVARMTSGENLPDDLCVLALRVSGATG
jgi:serine phosphatase RsbU (regulator of sigma subunit)